MFKDFSICFKYNLQINAVQPRKYSLFFLQCPCAKVECSKKYFPADYHWEYNLL